MGNGTCQQTVRQNKPNLHNHNLHRFKLNRCRSDAEFHHIILQLTDCSVNITEVKPVQIPLTLAHRISVIPENWLCKDYET